MAAPTNKLVPAQGTKFPEIVLDTTLAELLAEEPNWNVDEALCNIKPCANPGMRFLPVNHKYLITSASASDENDLAHLQLENVSYLLSFWAGNMEVSMMACEGLTEDSTLSKFRVEQNAYAAFSVLCRKQRPRPRIFACKDDFITYYQSNSTKLRWGFAVDFSEQLPCFIHPEKQYRLNAKRWLAECPLRSANDRVLDPYCECSTHTTKDGFWFCGGVECPTCKRAIDDGLVGLRDRLQNTEVPFVLKLTQALGSAGTMLVKSEKERDKAIRQILEIQSETLPRINQNNAHIYPASLVVSDFLPGDTNALNFYVRQDGTVKFLGACQQLSTRTTGGGRQHTALMWDRQDDLEEKFKTSLEEIGRVLHGEGYFGPCGADIMETEDGTQYVIDLNVRSATSLILGLLKNHCAKRNLRVCAVYECLLLSLEREDLETEFQKEFQEGRLIILGSTRLGKKDIWAYPVVIAGEDREDMKSLGARLLEHEADSDEASRDAGGA